MHDDFNAFLKTCGEDPYPTGEFFEESPYLNLLLYPAPVKFNREKPLDPDRFKYLEGCVRTEKPYDVPDFGEYNDKPLLYVSFGSLGAGRYRPDQEDHRFPWQAALSRAGQRG